MYWYIIEIGWGYSQDFESKVIVLKDVSAIKARAAALVLAETDDNSYGKAYAVVLYRCETAPMKAVRVPEVYEYEEI